jgi:hypothetical protein
MLFIEKKFGYYRANLFGNNFIETSSKIEALEIAKRFNGHVSYHFNDDEYSSYDWSQPINESINELYRQRAHQIREKYDHVVLLYSGGYDSENILKTFVNNNIHIDCIVSFYHELDKDNLVNNSLNVEWVTQTWPRLQKILPSIPNTEFVRLNISDLALNFIDQCYADYQYRLSYMIAPNVGARSSIRFKLKKKYQEGNTCILYGVDKPRLRYKNEKFIFNFLDVINSNNNPVNTDTGYEWFYWSADFPKLVIKQAQIVKQYWQSNFDNLLDHPKNRLDHNLGIVLDHEHQPVQQLVYPYCSDHLYLTFRPLSVVTGNRDTWLFESNTGHGEKLKKMIAARSSYPKEWFNNQDPQQGLIASISKDYAL